MSTRNRLVACTLGAAVVAAAALPAAADPVQDNLKRLKERLKAARTKAAAPNPGVTGPTSPNRRHPKAVRFPRVMPPIPKAPTVFKPRFKYDVEYLPHRVGTGKNLGDILVETKNGGKQVYVYWKLNMISTDDGRGHKENVLPGKYQIMLSGPTIKPWYYYLTVKPGHTTLLKVSL